MLCLPAWGPNFCTFLQLVFLLSILGPRAAHFQSCYCPCFMICYPYVHSFGPNFIIFRKHGNIPVGLHILALIEWLWLRWGVPRWNTVNRPLPSTKNPRFQNEARCTTFLVKMTFICMRMKNNFHIKGWAPTLVLKERPGGTWKWLISFRSSNLSYAFLGICSVPKLSSQR